MSFNVGRVSRVQKHLILQAETTVEGGNEDKPRKEVTLVDGLVLQTQAGGNEEEPGKEVAVVDGLASQTQAGGNEEEPGKEVTLVDELASLVVAEIDLS